MELLSITFNHGAASPAVNLRRSVAAPLPLPEWRPGVPAVLSEVAYPLDAGAGLTIRVELSAPELAGETAEVRAVEPAPPDGWDPEPADGASGDPGDSDERLMLLTSAVNVLGAVAARSVSFDAAGASGPQSFTLEPLRLDLAAVGVYPVRWQWQHRWGPGDPWVPFADTAHTVYLLVDRPRLPWREQPFTAANTQLPWTEVLAWACRWAFPARTAGEVAVRLTRVVFELGRLGVFEYGCVTGGMAAYTFLGFNCSAFLDRLAGGLGAGRYINCTDCAAMVSTFANALGSDLWQSQMRPSSPAVPYFQILPVLTIGAPAFGQPCGIWPGFTYHEVAWTGDCRADDDIFDSCLAVDAAPGFGPPVPLLPSGLRFGLAGEGDYRDLLCTPAGRRFCDPQPATRTRRPVF